MGACSLLVPALSFAAYINIGKNPDVGPLQIIQDNAYVAGGTATISGPVSGDLVAAGGTVFISGKITHDILAAGGTINISGASAEDVRIGGGTLIIGGNFSGELMAAGGTVTVTPDAQITKDSYVGAGTLAFDGNEAGSLTMSGGNIQVNGTIGKNLIIKKAGTVTIGAGAVIKGNFEYSAPSEAVIDSGAHIFGTTTFHKTENTASNNASGSAFLFGLFTLWVLWKIIAILIMTYIVWYVWKKDAIEMASEATSHFGRSLLRGFLFAVAVPVAIILTFITIFGALVGIFGIFAYVTLLILAAPAMVIFASSFIMKKTDLRWYHLLLGAVIIEVVRIIPFIGWIVSSAVYLAALGALLGILRSKFRRN